MLCFCVPGRFILIFSIHVQLVDLPDKSSGAQWQPPEEYPNTDMLLLAIKESHN